VSAVPGLLGFTEHVFSIAWERPAALRDAYQTVNIFDAKKTGMKNMKIYFIEVLILFFVIFVHFIANKAFL